MEQRNRRNSTNHTIEIGCPLLAVRCPLSAIRCPLSAIRCPLSAVRYPLSAIRYPLSAVRYPLSAVRCPLSAIRFWQGKFPSLEGQGWAFGYWHINSPLWRGRGGILATGLSFTLSQTYNSPFTIYNFMETYEIIARLHNGKDINAVIQDLADYKLIIQRKLAVSLNIWLLSCNDNAIIADDVLQAVSQHPDVLMAQRNHATTPRKTSLLG